jgi:hypothetical protein
MALPTSTSERKCLRPPKRERLTAVALDAFNSEGLEQLAAVETVEPSEMVLDATEAVN